MIKLFIILLTTSQTNPFYGTYTSTSRSLNFLDKDKCTLTIPTAWHGAKEQQFKWRIAGEDTIELTKLGFVKYTFQRVRYEERTYLVNIKNLADFRT